MLGPSPQGKSGHQYGGGRGYIQRCQRGVRDQIGAAGYQYRCRYCRVLAVQQKAPSTGKAKNQDGEDQVAGSRQRQGLPEESEVVSGPRAALPKRMLSL